MLSLYSDQPLAGRDKLEHLIINAPHLFAGIERQPPGFTAEADHREKRHDLAILIQRQCVAMGVPHGNRLDYIIQFFRPQGDSAPAYWRAFR